jgi:hypothetical protein
MAKPRSARKRVTSDPDPPQDQAPDSDHGLAVNSGTDPQRPRQPPQPPPDTPAAVGETSAPADRFEATHEPETTPRAEDVERGPRGGTDDAAK